MSDAPERIWFVHKPGDYVPYSVYHHNLNPGSVEYVRADLYDQQAAEIERLRAAQEWQPIETAPKDGTEFLAWYPPDDGDDGFFDIADWIEMPKFVNADSWTRGGLDPTHWMPLPEPPRAALGDG